MQYSGKAYGTYKNKLILLSSPQLSRDKFYSEHFDLYSPNTSTMGLPILPFGSII